MVYTWYRAVIVYKVIPTTRRTSIVRSVADFMLGKVQQSLWSATRWCAVLKYDRERASRQRTKLVTTGY